MCIDFRCHQAAPVNTTINGRVVEMFRMYEHNVRNDICWHLKTMQICWWRKASSIFSVAKLQVENFLIFYLVFIFNFICWSASPNLKQKTRYQTNRKFLLHTFCQCWGYLGLSVVNIKGEQSGRGAGSYFLVNFNSECELLMNRLRAFSCLR